MIYRNDRLAFSLSVTALLQLLTKTALCDNNERWTIGDKTVRDTLVQITWQRINKEAWFCANLVFVHMDSGYLCSEQVARHSAQLHRLTVKRGEN